MAKQVNHIFLWAIDTPEQLRVEEREALEDPSNDVLKLMAAVVRQVFELDMARPQT